MQNYNCKAHNLWHRQLTLLLNFFITALNSQHGMVTLGSMILHPVRVCISWTMQHRLQRNMNLCVWKVVKIISIHCLEFQISDWMFESWASIFPLICQGATSWQQKWNPSFSVLIMIKVWTNLLQANQLCIPSLSLFFYFSFSKDETTPLIVPGSGSDSPGLP